MNGSVRKARDTSERIITAFEKLSTGEMIEFFEGESSVLLGETPKGQPCWPLMGGQVPRVGSRQVMSCIYNPSFDPQGCLFLAEAFLGFKTYFTPLQPI